MRIMYIIPFLFLLFASCDNEKKNNDASGSQLTVTLDFQAKKQQIYAFGASDAWSCQFVGKNWPEQKREQIARLLFSNETDESGNPEGIGLSGWRFNIGGGSAEQESDSQIEDEWRRAECFLNPDGTYNWEKQSGQRWFLREAGRYGLDCFTAFVNSPPVSMTKNNHAWSAGGSSTNLKSEKFDDFSEFLTSVIGNLKVTDNIDFDYLSPANEPQWDWNDKGQEGSPYTNTEIADLTRELSGTLAKNGLSVKIEVPDAGHIVYLYKAYDKPERERQAYEFFKKESRNYIGDLPGIAMKVSGHSYFSTYPLNSMLLELRRDLADSLLEINPEIMFWQTEYCILESNDEISASGRDLGIDAALYTARVINFDLTLANSCSWYWWLAISPYDFKDGLVYIDKNMDDGNIYQSKLLWTLGNYSRFIRPGMFRYNVIRSDNKTDELAAKSLMVSGYGTEDQSKAVFVLVNYSKFTTYTIGFKTNLNREAKSMRVYTTSAKEDENLRLTIPEDLSKLQSIAPRSVVTVVLEF